MNLLKKFIRNDNADMETEDYDDLYIDPEDMPDAMGDPEDVGVTGVEAPKNEIRPVAEKVSLKLLQPKSHTEATKIAERLKEGSIVLLDISNLTKDQARRLVDFLAGVVFVLDGEMIKTNRNTIVLAPAGVDIAGIVPDEEAAPAPVPAPAPEPVYEEVGEVSEEIYEEI